MKSISHQPSQKACLTRTISVGAFFLAAVVCYWAQPVSAEPAFARQFKVEFGYVPSCNACHKDGGGTPVNAYGEQYKSAGMKQSSFKQIADLDADNDGSSNGAEVKVKSNPGDDSSTPEQPGEWLDTANLIPKEIQQQFPGVRAYLPKDAILTDKEIARAAAFGVTLGPEDQNTIYIPVENKRPAGTGIIVPASHGGKQFFLAVTTDKKLSVKAVTPTNTLHVPEAAKSKVYASFVGKNVKTLPAGAGDSLDDAIRNSVKKAVTLTYVRLKKAK